MGRYGDFEWDSVKDRQNGTEHGLPLIAGTAIFDVRAQLIGPPRKLTGMNIDALRLAKFGVAC